MFKANTPENRALARYIQQNPELKQIPADEIFLAVRGSMFFQGMVLGEAVADLRQAIVSEIKKILKLWRHYVRR